MTTYGASHLANSFRTVRKNTIQVAEDIPESKYGFTAAEGTRTVAQMLTHIAVVPRMWHDIHGIKKLKDMNGYDFMGLFNELTAEEKRPRSKAEIVALLTKEGETFGSFLEGLSDSFLAEEVIAPMGQPSKTRLESLMSAKEHEMHHRAQLMLMERMVGIVPHLTRRMEEMMREMQQPAAAAAQPA